LEGKKNMAGRKVSERTIRRLSHYARCLRTSRASGDRTVTSSWLSRQCGISSAAVRKDLTIFGEFGKQGSGYNVIELLTHIENILGTCDSPSIVIIGAGNIGRALLESGLRGTGGYTYSAIFDIDPDLIGTKCAGLTVKSMDDIRSTVSNYEYFIAVIAVTMGEGQKVVDRLLKAGCRAMLSFNLEPLELPEGVELRYIEVSTELDMLTHSMKR
jgi:redox-sensing transcriptional repressor